MTFCFSPFTSEMGKKAFFSAREKSIRNDADDDEVGLIETDVRLI